MVALDVDRAWALTPGCEHVVHLNHAGASLAPQPVLDTMIAHLQREAETGAYEAAAEAADRVEDVYRSVARLLGARPEEVALVDSHTTAWNAIVLALPLAAGERVVCTRSEYGSNALVLLQLRERTGCELVLVDDQPDGSLDLQAFAAALADGPVAFASLVYVPTGSGRVNPAAEVGQLCRDAGVPLVLDACQAVGQLDVDVRALGCSALTASGRKYLRGPRGTGFAWVDPELLPRLRPVTVDLRSATWVAPDRYEVRSDTRCLEQWELVLAARLGLGTAIDHALDWGLPAIEETVTAVAADLRARLAEVPGITVRDQGPRLCGITTFTVDGVAAIEVRDRLRALGTNVSVTDPGQARYDLPHRGLGDLVRASVHYTTTPAELDTAVAQIAAIAARQ